MFKKKNKKLYLKFKIEQVQHPCDGAIHKQQQQKNFAYLFKN